MAFLDQKIDSCIVMLICAEVNDAVRDLDGHFFTNMNYTLVLQDMI